MKKSNNVLAEYSYDALSRRAALTLGNDANIVYEYDIGNHLRKLTNNLDGTNSIVFEYADYDKVGNRKCMNIDDSTSSPPYDANAYFFTYDNLYQLIAVDYNNGYVTDYYYDQLGNRQKVINGGETLYDVNSLNQYTKVGTASYTYDTNGNLTYDGTETYGYDCENRLTYSYYPIRIYKYDYSGRRVQKTSTRYCYDGDQIIAHYNSSGTILLRKFVYGPGIDEPICMIVPAGQANAGTYYYHFDGLGSVVALSNINKEVVEKYRYDAFGKPTILSPSNEPRVTSIVGNAYMFTGREYDYETGNYYYRARYYSPRIGRFLQNDSVGYYSYSMNLYKYCWNNPVNWGDPYGLMPGIPPFIIIPVPLPPPFFLPIPIPVPIIPFPPGGHGGPGGHFVPPWGLIGEWGKDMLPTVVPGGYVVGAGEAFLKIVPATLSYSEIIKRGANEGFDFLGDDDYDKLREIIDKTTECPKK